MSMRPLNILIMNRKYDRIVGGVERMSTQLANEMSARGHKCHIVSLDFQGAEMYFDLDPRVEWHKVSEMPADRKANWGERFRRFAKIRRIMSRNKIDVAIGFQDGAYLSLMVSGFGSGIPVVAAERNAPTRFQYLKNKMMPKIVFNSFRLADRITVQCESYRLQYPYYLRHKIVTISNPVKPAMDQASPEGSEGLEKRLLFVGRLGFQKNVPVLIRAFAMVKDVFPDWILYIAGGGEEMEKIGRLAIDLNVQDRIFMLGEVKDVQSLYVQSHLFCLPSLWEGFPNALAEAMSHGLPAVGFERCAGVRDLIVDGRSGYLAAGSDDPKTLADCLARLMGDNALRGIMGAAAKADMAAHAPPVVFDRWELLFSELAGAQ